MTTNSLMVIDAQQAISAARGRKDIVVQMRKDNILRDKVDFGVVPGTNKPTLLKPGAERLCAAFGLNPQFEVQSCVERWDGDDPLFFYQVLCHLIHIDSGLEVATGLGSCNSRESKWRWRWVSEENVPPHLDKTRLERKASALFEFDFAVRKAETTGPYGKTAEYWQQFKDAIEKGEARKVQRETKRGMSDGWEIGSVSYRVPNDDPFSLINTYLKMACKRALIAAVLIGANASEFFTQDVEDMPGFGVDIGDLDDTVEGSFEEVVEQHANGTPPPEERPAQPKNSVRQQSTDTPKRDWTGFWVAWEKAGLKRGDKPQIKQVLGVESTYGMDINLAFSKLEAYATPKSSEPALTVAEWSPEAIEAFDSYALDNFNFEIEDALELLGKKMPHEMGSLENAKELLKSAAYTAGRGMIARSATYIQNGNNKYVRFNTPIDIRLYGRDLIRQLGEDWLKYADSWEPGQTYTFEEAGLTPLMIAYEKHDGYAQATHIEEWLPF